MVQPRAGQGAVQIALRLPPEMRDQIKAAAEENGRSINSEIIARLESSFAPTATSGGILVPQQEWLKMLHEIERFAEGAEKIIEAGKIIQTKHKPKA